MRWWCVRGPRLHPSLFSSPLKEPSELKKIACQTPYLFSEEILLGVSTVKMVVNIWQAAYSESVSRDSNSVIQNLPLINQSSNRQVLTCLPFLLFVIASLFGCNISLLFLRFSAAHCILCQLHSPCRIISLHVLSHPSSVANILAVRTVKAIGLTQGPPDFVPLPDFERSIHSHTLCSRTSCWPV